MPLINSPSSSTSRGSTPSPAVISGNVSPLSNVSSPSPEPASSFIRVINPRTQKEELLPLDYVAANNALGSFDAEFAFKNTHINVLRKLLRKPCDSQILFLGNIRGIRENFVEEQEAHMRRGEDFTDYAIAKIWLNNLVKIFRASDNRYIRLFIADEIKHYLWLLFPAAERKEEKYKKLESLCAKLFDTSSSDSVAQLTARMARFNV